MIFSIVIPTRNRPGFLKSSLLSVLSQDFVDFEIIISDNSSPHFSNKVKSLISSIVDHRINYIRPTSELPMAEHWEWAAKHATGEYIGILTDRMVFKKNALTKLKILIDRKEPNLILSATNGRSPWYTLISTVSW